MNKIIQFSRIKDWWYLNGIFLLGLIYSGVYYNIKIDLLISLTVSSLYLLHGYSLNEFFDNASTYFKGSPKRKALFFAITFSTLIINLFLSYYISKTLALIILCGTVVSWIYSAPPLFLKRSAYGRLFLNGLGFSLLFLAGSAFRSALSMNKIFLFIYFLLLFIPIEAIHDINDMPSDKARKINTLPLKKGIHWTINFIAICFATLFAYSFFLYIFNQLHLFVCLLTFALSFSILFLLYSTKKKAKDINKAFKGIKKKTKIIFSFYGLWLLLLFLLKH